MLIGFTTTLLPTLSYCPITVLCGFINLIHWLIQDLNSQVCFIVVYVCNAK